MGDRIFVRGMENAFSTAPPCVLSWCFFFSCQQAVFRQYPATSSQRRCGEQNKVLNLVHTREDIFFNASRFLFLLNGDQTTSGATVSHFCPSQGVEENKLLNGCAQLVVPEAIFPVPLFFFLFNGDQMSSGGFSVERF